MESRQVKRVCCSPKPSPFPPGSGYPAAPPSPTSTPPKPPLASWDPDVDHCRGNRQHELLLEPAPVFPYMRPASSPFRLPSAHGQGGLQRHAVEMAGAAGPPARDWMHSSPADTQPPGGRQEALQNSGWDL